MSTITVLNSNDSGAGSLRAALTSAQSGDTIAFASSLSNQTITLSSRLDIADGKNLTIDGAAASGLKISGNNANQIFNVNSTSVSQTQFTLKNVILSNAKSTELGAAIYMADMARVSLSGVEFRDNVSTKGGSAVYANRGTLTIDQSKFTNNQAISANDERGSTVTAIEAIVTVTNSVFSGNKGINGAAINTLNSKLTVDNSKFFNNDTNAAYYGSNDPNGNNFLRGYGGAIYTDRANNATVITNSVFDGNQSKAAGGALYLFNDPEDTVTVQNSTFGNNKALGLSGGEAGNGGAIEMQRNSKGGVANLIDNSFVGNEVNGQGGAVRVANTETVNISNSTFSQNRVNGSGYAAVGGGLVAYGSTVNVLNSTFGENYAGWVGGGISAGNDATVNLQNTIFYKNTAGNGGNPWKIQYDTNRQLNDWGGNFSYTPGSSDKATASITVSDPKLGALQQYGDQYFYPLLTGSPAINTAVGSAPTTDGRGVARVGAADSGSFEFGSVAVVPTAPDISVADLSISEGNSGTKVALYTVSLSKAALSAVSVNYATTNGTATGGSDYVATNGTLTFAAGETSKTVSVTINGDTSVEDNETFFLNLSNAIGGNIVKNQAIGTITNDDIVAVPLPQFSISDLSITEGNSGTKAGVFTISRFGASTGAVSVNYATVNGTAISGSDYQAMSGTLAFAAGETSKTVSVSILGDTTVEADETFFVDLSNATGATLLKARGNGTITNDDIVVAVPLPTVLIQSKMVTEGNSGIAGLPIVVSLSTASTQIVKVNYATVNGTAIAGSDYQAMSGTLTFAAGETSKTLTLNIVGDTVSESTEAFSIQVSSAYTGLNTPTANAAMGTITIQDNDIAPAPTVIRRNDFNGDGSTDLIWRDSISGAVEIWSLNKGQYVSSAGLSVNQSTSKKLVASGDFSGDGKPDMLWRDPLTGANEIWGMNGTAPIPVFNLPNQAAGWDLQGVGDINGDKKLDLVWHNKQTGGNEVWLMNGTSITSKLTLDSVINTNWKVEAIADFNGDGRDDLLWRDAVAGANQLWTTNANGTVIKTAVTTFSADWTLGGTGDFNGDGKTDLFWQQTGGKTLFLINKTATANDWGYFNGAQAATGQKFLGASDLNNDGRADLLYKTANGSAGAWMMAQDAVFGGAMTTTLLRQGLNTSLTSIGVEQAVRAIA